MLKIINIHKAFGEQKVLNGLTFDLEKGKIYTLIGGNGSGKTTLFNIISGFIRPDKGQVIFKGKEISKTAPFKITRAGISSSFQDLRLITTLPVRENILLSFKHNPGENILKAMMPPVIIKKNSIEFLKKADEILERIHLSEVADNLAGEISYGQQKLLTLGCCLANNPELILLDEPVAGIDEKNYENIRNIISILKQEGKTILQIEHHKEYIKEQSDKILFLNDGIISAFDNYETFGSNETVKSIYLN